MSSEAESEVIERRARPHVTRERPAARAIGRTHVSERVRARITLARAERQQDQVSINQQRKHVAVGSVVAMQLRHQILTLVFLISRLLVRIPSLTPVSLSKTLHHCFVLWMGRKVVGPVCCVNACKQNQCTYLKEKGFAPVFLAVAAVCAVAPCKPL